ncbi:MAG: Lrp/AsnC family transcriptional regulator [bacterium]|jgi:DNA-binding Lrp family transcriptional regulator
MVTAFILMNAERGRINDAAQELLTIRGITEVHSVAGEYDLIAIARVKKNEDLARLVTEDLIKVQGITKTETQIAFRQYSNYDLDRMFELED